MSRVQNLLPVAPAVRRVPEAAPSTGRDFDDVMAQTYQQPGRRTEPDRQASPDRPETSARSDQVRPGSPQHLRPSTGGGSAPVDARGEVPENAPAVAGNTGPDAPAATEEQVPVARDQQNADDANPDNQDETPVPVTGTDVVAEPLADVVIDPVLLASMVTIPATVLTPATAPEPEPGMVSVAAVDGGTAVIVTAPTVAVPAGQAPIDEPTPKTTVQDVAPTAAVVAPGAAVLADRATSGPGDAAAPTTDRPAPAAPLAPPAPVATALPTAPAAAATAATAVTGIPAVPGTQPTDTAMLPVGTAPVAGTVSPAATTTADAPETATEANGPGGVSPAGTPVPASTPLAAGPGPVVDPLAAALAGAYGVAPAGSNADRPADPVTDTPEATGALPRLGPVGGSPIGGAAIGSNGPDTSPKPDSDRSGGSPAAATSDVPTTTTTSGTNPSTVVPPTSVPGAPMALDVPVAGTTGIPGVTGVPGVTGTAPSAPTAPAERSARSSEITDQVAAQIGRQLQGVRMLRDGTHHTVLRLSPEHLGEVTITLDVRAGGLRLDLAAGSQVLVALQADLGRLRDDLANSGLALGDVTLTSQDAGPGTNGQPTSRERWQDPAATGRGGDGPRNSTTATDQFARRPAGRTGDGGLDVLA